MHTHIWSFNFVVKEISIELRDVQNKVLPDFDLNHLASCVKVSIKPHFCIIDTPHIYYSVYLCAIRLSNCLSVSLNFGVEALLSVFRDYIAVNLLNEPP